MFMGGLDKYINFFMCFFLSVTRKFQSIDAILIFILKSFVTFNSQKNGKKDKYILIYNNKF